MDSQCFSPRLSSTYAALPLPGQTSINTTNTSQSTNTKNTLQQPFFNSGDNMLLIDDEECEMTLGSRHSPDGATNASSRFHRQSLTMTSSDDSSLKYSEVKSNLESLVRNNTIASSQEISLDSGNESSIYIDRMDPSKINFIDSYGEIMRVDFDELFDSDLEYDQPTSTEDTEMLEESEELDDSNRRTITVKLSAATEMRLRRHLSFEPTPNGKIIVNDTTADSSFTTPSTISSKVTRDFPQRENENQEQQYKKKTDLKRKLKIFAQLFSRKNDKSMKLTTLAHV